MKLLNIINLACILQFSFHYMQTDNKQQIAVNKPTACMDFLLQTDSVNTASLNKFYNHRMPILLSDVETILGKKYMLTKGVNPPETDHYFWETKDGVQYDFEDINYNEKGIELDRLTVSSKQVVKHPLGIYLNKSTLAACKKTFAGLKKSLDERTYKFRKNKTWYFLEFNKQNVLVKIKSVAWDTDMSG